MIYSKSWKGKFWNLRYSILQSFTIEGEIKNFSDKQRLKQFININLKPKRNVKRSSLNGKEVRFYRKGKYIVRIEDLLNKPVGRVKFFLKKVWKQL